LRVVYDDDALYVAVDCEQKSAAVVRRLAGRDREVEADWVSVSLDPRQDGKSAFVFEVNAGGTLLDGIRYNDSEFSTDWDENWGAWVSVRERGWSVEYRIPFRILRFRTLPQQSWGLDVRRYISRKQETDEWPLISRTASAEVSHYGKLDGLSGLSARGGLELRPSASAKMRHQDATTTTVPTLGDATLTSSAPSITDFSLSFGLDLKWHPTQDLTLDATLNPEFAQVEADQLVLNLTTFETYHPEKRPFFLEGADLFATPVQLLYTRRIGSVPSLPALRPAAPPSGKDEQLLDVPQPTTIWGASKLTGRIADGWTVGTLQAVTGENTVPVAEPDGSKVARVVAPLSAWNVLRLRGDLSERAYLGAMFTGVTRVEGTENYPRLPGVPGVPPQSLCPTATDAARNTTVVAPGARCFNDAYDAAVDWRWRSNDGNWTTNGQLIASLLGPGPPRYVPDGTVVRPGDVATGSQFSLTKDGGDHWVGDVWAGHNDRKFDYNDVGYNQRSNLYWDGVDLEYRTLEPWRMFLETHSRLEYWDAGTFGGILLNRGLRLSTAGKLDNYWRYLVAFHWRQRHVDDREMGDGAALERAGVYVGNETRIQTDPTATVSFVADARTEPLDTGGINFNGSAGALLHALAQLDFELLPTATYNCCEPRFVALGPSAGEYLFGHLRAASAGATLRATYAFTPQLTLQGYAQLFLASGHYSNFLSYQSNPNGPRPVVHLSALQPAASSLLNPDFQQGALNANLFLRWEWQPGSLVYLVYTRVQVPNVSLAPGEAGTLDLGSVRRAPAADTLVVKVSYWWG
jgi:hypothetical protein